MSVEQCRAIACKRQRRLRYILFLFNIRLSEAGPAGGLSALRRPVQVWRCILRVVLPQRDAVIVGAGGGQPRAPGFSSRKPVLQQIAGDILHRVRCCPRRRRRTTYSRTVPWTHLRLFKQELLEADNIEEVALLFAVEIATETAKRYPLFLLFKPGGFIHQRVEAGNRDLIHDFTATNQRDAVE